MSGALQEGEPGAHLGDYRTHYRVDAGAIVDPEVLHPRRRASEDRRFEALVRLLDLGGGDELLDLGCGSGWLAERCRRRGARVRAVDLAPAGVAAARARYPRAGCFLAGDAYFLPFASRSFDAVVLSEVLEHLEDTGRALGEVRRVLRLRGRALVCVPYREHIVQHLCIHCNRPTPGNAHLHSFDEEKLTALLRAQGLEVRGVLLLNNKLLELAGFPLRSRRWPYWAWRGADRLCNRLCGRPAFLAVLAAGMG